MDVEKFRHREWAPALRAAGSHRRIYDCRHTFATWAIEAAVQLRTSRRSWGRDTQLEDTYFRWLRRTDEQLRAAFDRYDVRAVSSAGSSTLKPCLSPLSGPDATVDLRGHSEDANRRSSRVTKARPCTAVAGR